MPPSIDSPRHREVVIDGPVDVGRTLGQLYLLGGAMCTLREGSVFWRASRNVDGIVTTRFEAIDSTDAQTRVAVDAWGPGAAAELERAPNLLGARDPVDDFVPPAPLKALHHKMKGLRFPASGEVANRLVMAVLGQKVTTKQAARGWRGLVGAFGEPAPGPVNLVVPPSAETIGSLSPSQLVRFDIEGHRAAILREVGFRHRRLDSLAELPAVEAFHKVQVLRGIGPWTASVTVTVTHGTADMPWLGDYHLPNTVSWLLAGEERGDDARMLELLEPYRPHRGRVQMMLKYSGSKAPRRGPKTDVRRLY